MPTLPQHTSGRPDAARIAAFFAQERIALVGVSRNPQDLSRKLFRDLIARGYCVFPIHPKMKEVDGRPCHASVRDIFPPVEAALLMTPAAITETVVHECAEAGVRLVWMHRGAGVGSVSPAAVAFCHGRGIEVVAGACPYMFLPQAGFVHGLHAFLARPWHRILHRPN